VTWKIYGRDESPMLEIVVGDWSVFGMTLGGVKPESREWLAAHLDRAFEEQIERAEKRGAQRTKQEFRKLIGVES
jgi:hypothetical protein